MGNLQRSFCLKRFKRFADRNAVLMQALPNTTHGDLKMQNQKNLVKKTSTKLTSTTSPKKTTKTIAESSTKTATKTSTKSPKSTQNLIIVESPAKAKTIKNFLGQGYEVIASKGHIRDLPKFSFGIKIENKHFTPQYTIDEGHKDTIAQIKALAKNAKTTYIATDEDREGEAIGYHITQALDSSKPLSSYPRIVFHEITKTAISNALASPREIDMDKVNAQQARRLLDRIVGFKLSGLISSKISKGLSAGRVQSAALKIIVDKEREIRAFIPQDFFTISAVFDNVESELVIYKGKKLQKLDISSQSKADEMLEHLKSSSYTIAQITRKEKKVSTPPPFMTSTLQQAASSGLSYSPTRTMSIAQRLYEGVQTDKGTMGVITYMRTDSLNIAKEATQSARAHLAKAYGDKYVPQKPKIYTSKSKGAQEAHEAIRPTNIDFTPQIAKGYLKPDELKLYTLIYNRFLASQSEDALYETQTVSFATKTSPSEVSEFRANGRKLIFDGFYKILGNEDKDKLLPDLKQGEDITPSKITASKHTTEPPARYSEASLIKTLESLGIGRPSTYAPTVSLLVNREYISIQNRALIPQDSAFSVIELLEAHFNEIVDSAFSAGMEEKLDSIALKNASWQEVLWDFYEPFIAKIEQGKTNIASQKLAKPTGESCPQCGKELIVRKSRYGEFVGCSGYPKCKYIKRESSDLGSASGEVSEANGVCEKCGKPMVKKMSKRGEFLACSGYPACKNAKSLGEKKEAIALEGIACPECGKESIVQRMGRRGAFYGCKNYPKCKFTSPLKPTNTKCQKCGSIMGEKSLKSGEFLECLKCKNRIEV